MCFDASDSTASRWGCRTSTPTSSRPSRGSNRSSSPATTSEEADGSVSRRSTSTSSTGCLCRPRRASAGRSVRSSKNSSPTGWRASPTPTCRGSNPTSANSIPDAMPTGWEKFRLFAGAAEEFVSAGYSFVGFDHFARPGDELARALDEDRVHRNFMGYTIMPASDQIGVGVTSIGDVAGAYVANDKKLARHGRRSPKDGSRWSAVFEITRGRNPSRRDQQHHLHSQARLRLDRAAIGTRPRVYFADALKTLSRWRRTASWTRRPRAPGDAQRPLLPPQPLHALRRLPPRADRRPPVLANRLS